METIKQTSNEQKMHDQGSERFIDNNLNTSFVHNFKGINILKNEVLKLESVIEEIRQKGTNGKRLTCFNNVPEEITTRQLIATTLFTILQGVAIQNSVASVVTVSANHLADSIFKTSNKKTITYALQITDHILNNTDLIKRVDKREKKNSKPTFEVNEQVLSNIGVLIQDLAKNEFYPLPMTEPPIDWVYDDSIGNFVGGYKTKNYQIIRGLNDAPRWLKQNPDLLNALNNIQSVPFKINKTVLEAVKEELNERKEKFKTTTFNSKKLKESEEGKIRALSIAVGIAEQYKDEPEIYFPHNFDYRGRIYPIPIMFNTQGTKEIKGMLEFANPVKLTENGINNLYAYLGSTLGFDKEPKKRRERAGRLAMRFDVSYKKADEKFVYLQVKETLKRVEYSDLTSYVAIHVDGSCNGLQHLSALTKCNKGALSVNLTDTHVRHDIYLEVAKEALKLCNDIDIDKLFSKIDEQLPKSNDEDYNQALILAKTAIQGKVLKNVFSGKMGRKVCKRPTMIKPYSGTVEGMIKYIKDEIGSTDFNYLVKESYYAENTDKTLNPITRLLAKIVSGSINSNVYGGNEFEQWAKETGSLIAKAGKMPFWITPDGFKVRPESWVYDVVKFEVQTGKKKQRFSLRTKTNKINIRGIRNNISPNLVHSLDSTHLRLTLKKAISSGINDVWFIHDSFACDANNIDKLSLILRNTFIDLYNDVTRINLEHCFKNQSNSVKQIPVVGDYDINEVAKNEYFFA